MTGPFPVLAVALALATPSESFDRGKVAFGRGEYQRAIKVLSPLVFPVPTLESENEIVQAYRMLGVAHLFEKQTAEARTEFVKLLELRPGFRFDPLLDPPQVVEFFNGIVAEQRVELERIEAAKRREAERRKAAEEELRRNPPRILVYRKVERRSRAVAFVPFGVGQFQNDQVGKGRAFLIAESALGLASVGTFVANFWAYGLRQEIPCKPDASDRCVPDVARQRVSNDLRWTSFGTGVAFWAVVGWGIIDALHNFREEVPVGPDVEQPPGLTGARARAVELAPALAADGIGLVGRF